MSVTADEPPDELLCPITYTLFRDPVTCLADGRTYECSALYGFWRHRPLADFHGGPRLACGRVVPALAVRKAVCLWLVSNPEAPPPGWQGRDAGQHLNQEELDRMAADIELCASAQDAAMAAERGDAIAEEEAARALAAFASAVCLVGRLPRRCTDRVHACLGTYDRCDGMLVAGRYAYMKRDEPDGAMQPMLWFATNGFWHAGERRFLGQPTGWLIVGDTAAAPEHIAAVWQASTSSGYKPARRLRCVTADESGVAVEPYSHDGAPDATLNRGESDDTDIASDTDTDSATGDEDALAGAAASVHLTVAAAGPALGERNVAEYFGLSTALILYLGSYDRLEWDAKVNGRFVYKSVEVRGECSGSRVGSGMLASVVTWACKLPAFSLLTAPGVQSKSRVVGRPTVVLVAQVGYKRRNFAV